jgi:hypothetical protein
VGQSSWSAESSITTAPAPPRTPAPPEITVADDAATLRVSWERSTEALPHPCARARACKRARLRVRCSDSCLRPCLACATHLGAQAVSYRLCSGDAGSDAEEVLYSGAEVACAVRAPPPGSSASFRLQLQVRAALRVRGGLSAAVLRCDGPVGVVVCVRIVRAPRAHAAMLRLPYGLPRSDEARATSLINCPPTH